MFEGSPLARKYKIKQCECPSGKMTRFIEPCLLFFLSQKPSYGYELMEQLNNYGFQKAKPDPAMVYRTLRHLEKENYVVSKWDTNSIGPAKRNYELTPKGLSLLHAWAGGITLRKKALEKFLKLYHAAFKNRAYFLIFAFLLLSGPAGLAQVSSNSVKTLSLDECISQALETHPKLSIYERKTYQKESRLRAITAENLPQINAVASYDRLSYAPQMKQRYLGNSNNDYQADIVVTQPLYTGGKITSQKKHARYAIDAAEQGYLAVREDVIFSVKTAYYKLIYFRDILKNKEALLKYAQNSYSTALDLNKRTKTPREETLLRLAVQLNEVRQELITAQDSLKIAQKALLNAMGLDINGSLDIEDLKDDLVFNDNMLIEIANNNELLKLSKELKQADELMKIARSDFYPQLRARYSYGYEWARLNEGATDWIAGVSADFNLWDWGNTRANVNQAKAYKEELQSYANLLRQQIGLELESARLKYGSASKRLELAKTSFEQAKRSLDLFESRYRDALVTSFELLDAQKAFAQSQVNYASAMLDIRLAKAEIEKIAGRGYDLK
ncbi:MAG: TolC family protein [bacterium]|nr:TolC family protein [bacterium]MDD5757288.1 TolC family protein [bacterium]